MSLYFQCPQQKKRLQKYWLPLLSENFFFQEPLSGAIKDKRKTMSMIAAFYNGKSILITGATGFMGKVLMEKLFRTSPDLKVIYILVRPKAGQTTQQRVFQILNSKSHQVFFVKAPNCLSSLHSKSHQATGFRLTPKYIQSEAVPASHGIISNLAMNDPTNARARPHARARTNARTHSAV
uniref:Fatty acyl-CoA reductase n=1 Tax=Ursus maritimus TaxID=29073 RepID=A0A452T1V6_URSMA